MLLCCSVLAVRCGKVRGIGARGWGDRNGWEWEGAGCVECRGVLIGEEDLLLVLGLMKDWREMYAMLVLVC